MVLSCGEELAQVATLQAKHNKEMGVLEAQIMALKLQHDMEMQALLASRVATAMKCAECAIDVTKSTSHICALCRKLKCTPKDDEFLDDERGCLYDETSDDENEDKPPRCTERERFEIDRCERCNKAYCIDCMLKCLVDMCAECAMSDRRALMCCDFDTAVCGVSLCKDYVRGICSDRHEKECGCHEWSDSDSLT